MTNISELISKLERIRVERGDLPVATGDCFSPDFIPGVVEVETDKIDEQEFVRIVPNFI